MQQWYELLFKNYAVKYDEESFTKGTVGECDFIESECVYNKQIKILDIGCGTGRHAIELAKRGYNVTGIDLSESQLKRAGEKASAAGLDIKFLQMDARALKLNAEFDMAIMICEGAFSLMETDEMNFDILKGAANSLRSNGKFIFTALNGLFPLFHSVKDFLAKNTAEGRSECVNNSFDLMTFRDKSITKFTDDDGIEHVLECNERFYVPSEITWQLKSLGFTKIDIFGAKLGAFSRNDKLTTEDFEMLVIAEK